VPPRSKKRKPYEPYPRALVKRLPDLEPPVAEDDERAVLASMLVFGESARRGAATLRPEDFYGVAHQSIFAVMVGLVKDRRPVDVPQVRAKLGTKLDEIGDVYLDELLLTDFPTPQTFRVRADLVREASALRQQLTAMCAYMQQPQDEKRLELFRTLELSTVNGLEVVSGDDLLAEKIEVEWLIDRLFPLGGVTILAADPGAGKSWLALSLCHAMANRFPKWLGHFPIKRKGGALYVDCETGRAAQKERLELLDIGAGVGPTAVQVIDPWAEDEDTPEPGEQEQRPLGFVFDAPVCLGPGIAVLESHIRDWRAHFVVLDSLSRMMPPGSNEKDNSDVNMALTPVANLARRTMSNITVIHHLAKEGQEPRSLQSRIRGAGAIAGQCDVALVMTGSRDGPKIVHQVKGRLSPTRERSFRLAFEGGEGGRGTVLSYAGTAETLEAEVQGQARALILEIVTEEGMLRQDIIREVADSVQADSESGERPKDRTIQRVLTLLYDEKVLDKRREGNAVRYFTKGTVGGLD